MLYEVHAWSRDADLPLEKVKCGKTDADGHWSLDPVHAQAFEHPSHALLLEQFLKSFKGR